MDTDAMTDYYWENLKDILQRQLADDDEYRALIQKKIAAEIALKALIGEEASCTLRIGLIHGSRVTRIISLPRHRKAINTA